MYNSCFHYVTAEKGCDSMYRCCGCNGARILQWNFSSYSRIKRQTRYSISNPARYEFHNEVSAMSLPDKSIHSLQFHQFIERSHAKRIATIALLCPDVHSNSFRLSSLQIPSDGGVEKCTSGDKARLESIFQLLHPFFMHNLLDAKDRPARMTVGSEISYQN